MTRKSDCGEQSSWQGGPRAAGPKVLEPMYCYTCCDVCGRNLVTVLTYAASPRVDISSTCKVGQKLGVSLPLMTCSPSA